MFGWLFRRAVTDAAERGDSEWQTTPRAAEPVCNCRECQRARAAHLADLGLLPGVAPRSTDVTWATDPTVYRNEG